MPEVRFPGATVPAGPDLFELARGAGVHLESTCLGRGTCGLCRVVVTRPDGGPATAGELSPPTDAELRLLPPGALERGVRLACQSRAREDVAVEPVYRRATEDAGKTSAPEAVAAEDPVVRLEGDRVVWAFGGGELELARLEPGDSRRLYGIAVDLGTTTAVGHLVDLRSGRVVASRSLANAQKLYGADVMSRLTVAMNEPGGALRVRRAGLQTVSSLARVLLALGGASHDEVYEVLVVGNTAMHHLLAGLELGGLGGAPYEPVTLEPIHAPAAAFGLDGLGRARVTLPPVVGGFVGSDALAAAWGTGLGPLELVVDIGTNGEVVLDAGGRRLAASAPAGPAFEGEGLTSGAPFGPGAVTRVELKGDLRLTVEGGGTPIGLCGTGLISAVAALRRAGGLRKDGALLALGNPNPAVRARGASVNGAPAIRLAPDLLLSQRDVRSLQDAKAAVRSAIDMVLLEAGLAASDLRRIKVAGAFGSRLEPADLVTLGVLPAVPADRVEVVGQAAGLGALGMLASASAREDAYRFARSIDHVDLAGREVFQDVFLAAMSFG